MHIIITTIIIIYLSLKICWGNIDLYYKYFMCKTLYLNLYVHHSVLTTKSLVSISYPMVDPFYPFHSLHMAHLVTTTLSSVSPC